ncbi:MAG TPA: undecaprenyl-diphosphate phosphatase [Opitutaceae bacterium]|nr:undecaprenyl-diphosphate phosphatase [Opitutaceae bacterium]
MRIPLVFVTLALAALPLRGQTKANAVDSHKSQPIAELHTSDAIILGVIEGVTEYLPVSSTGHLVIANRFLGLQSDQPLHAADGHLLWFKKPSARHPQGEPLTLDLAAKTYSIVIQFGAIAAVALLYWSQLMAMLRGLFGKDEPGRRLLVNVIVAFLPAAVIGLLLASRIDQLLSSVWAVIFAQVAGALLMFYAEARRRRREVKNVPEGHVLNDLTPKSALGIGFMQCLAMWPGTSRSMTTIVGGYFAGLDPRRAAEFSFILGFVTLSAATVYKSLQSGAAMIEVFGWSHVLLGCVVAAVVAALCVRFLVRWLTRHGLSVFAWYRIAIAAVLAAILLH